MDTGALIPREIRRYERQMLIPGIGPEGQGKIKNSSVLIIGAGGMGCAVLQYLAASGIGRIGIVDWGMVTETSLRHQILYGSLDIGKLKSIIVKDRMKQLNDLVKSEIYNLRLESKNALNLLAEYDIIIDASDNLAAKYLINDSCVILNKPMVYGSVTANCGETGVFNYEGSATFRCYMGSLKGKKTFSDSPESASHGVVYGITGNYMAAEVIKIVTCTGEILKGKVLCFNIMNNTNILINVDNNTENHKISALQNEY